MTERLQDSTVGGHQKPRSRSKTHSEQESSDLLAVFQYGAQTKVQRRATCFQIPPYQRQQSNQES